MGGWSVVGSNLEFGQADLLLPQHRDDTGMAGRKPTCFLALHGKRYKIGREPRLFSWTILLLLLLVGCGWLCGGVHAQQPPGVTLPSPFPPPGAALPPDVAVPPAPPVPSENEAIQMLQQQVQKMTQNITSALENKYGFCITDG